MVSIRPPPFDGGNREYLRLHRRRYRFQSAPRLSTGGIFRHAYSAHRPACCNPPPAFRRGESCGGGHGAERLRVSIRPPPFDGGNLLVWFVLSLLGMFQSAPRLSTGGILLATCSPKIVAGCLCPNLSHSWHKR